jgi:hypothetical protein
MIYPKGMTNQMKNPKFEVDPALEDDVPATYRAYKPYRPYTGGDSLCSQDAI